MCASCCVALYNAVSLDYQLTKYMPCEVSFCVSYFFRIIKTYVMCPEKSLLKIIRGSVFLDILHTIFLPLVWTLSVGQNVNYFCSF